MQSAVYGIVMIFLSERRNIIEISKKNSKMFARVKLKLYFCIRKPIKVTKMNKLYTSYFYFYFAGHCEAGSCV